jgi:hypothetical protein
MGVARGLDDFQGFDFIDNYPCTDKEHSHNHLRNGYGSHWARGTPLPSPFDIPKKNEIKEPLIKARLAAILTQGGAYRDMLSCWVPIYKCCDLIMLPWTRGLAVHSQAWTLCLVWPTDLCLGYGSKGDRRYETAGAEAMLSLLIDDQGSASNTPVVSQSCLLRL